jgi:uncharacterized repeat protein (TIGR04076 family)
MNLLMMQRRRVMRRRNSKNYKPFEVPRAKAPWPQRRPYGNPNGNPVIAYCSIIMSTTAIDDSFQLYDLRVEVICPPGERILCGAKNGDHFVLEGEMLRLPPDQGFSIYSLGPKLNRVAVIAQKLTFLLEFSGAVLPLLAAKQRVTSPNDWMNTDAEVACPDPHCPSRLKITRIGLRTLKHGDVTAVPLPQ